MRRVAVIIVAVVVAVASGTVAQEAYPTRPVTIVNPFPPGGIADLTARPLAAALERLLKQPFVVSNKPGAAGAVGAQSVAVAKPDGYTLLVALVSISSTPEVDKLFGRPAIYTRDQFVGIARLNADPPLLVVNEEYARKHGWTTLKELVDDARKRPGEITYASSGPYGASHLPIEMLLAAAGLKMRHLPTTGGAPATTAVLGGHAQLWASPPALALPHIQAGKMRPLRSSATRSSITCGPRSSRPAACRLPWSRRCATPPARPCKIPSCAPRWRKPRRRSPTRMPTSSRSSGTRTRSESPR